FTDVLNFDLSIPAFQAEFVLNGSAQWSNSVLGDTALHLTNDHNQAGSGFLKVPIPLSKYRLSFDFLVTKESDPDSRTGDGFCFVAQALGPDKVCSDGGALGYEGSPFSQPNLTLGPEPYSYAVELNHLSDNGLANFPQTVALDVTG